eukprot:gnl/TRDRNA2_/TRDRNA2_128979_c0_seq1.p1 gnl/TRDRNA2_/TRDRNA2_128979_c0~~gnl/TRDRNA2_/TRDRNA2_128979_c0_seq1.p1  ORF type:complete len:141 (+),score=26.00 gnl/TRDRNA2_/TRDRNA2_128979_c0_seq1:83-505(+)
MTINPQEVPVSILLLSILLVCATISLHGCNTCDKNATKKCIRHTLDEDRKMPDLMQEAKCIRMLKLVICLQDCCDEKLEDLDPPQCEILFFHDAAVSVAGNATDARAQCNMHVHEWYNSDDAHWQNVISFCPEFKNPCSK